MKLHVIKPSVNNLVVRVFVRAAGLTFEEFDAYGKTDSAEFVALCPSQLTPMLEDPALPRGAIWESCAIMQYLCNQHDLQHLYPAEAAERAMQDSAMFYLIGSLYPLVARAAYPRLGFPLYPGEVGASDADDDAKERARKSAEDALAPVLDVYRDFFLAGQTFIGGEAPTIADIRFAATLEFLRITDFAFPDWLKAFLDAVGAALGDAWSEPVADVRGYIDYVRSQ